MVATRGDGHNDKGNLGGDLAGGAYMANQELYTRGSGSGSRSGWGRQAYIQRCEDRDRQHLDGQRTLSEQHIGIEVWTGIGTEQ